VVWMDRTLFRDESLMVFQFICCLLVFDFEFYFFQRCCKKVGLVCHWAAPCKCVRGYWQPSCKFAGSEDINNSLANFLWDVRGYRQPHDKFLRGAFASFAKSTHLPGLPIPFDLCRRAVLSLWSSWQKLLENP
jgi:hypothetical protein